MKYYKITDLTTGQEHCISSSLPNESITHVWMGAHLDPDHKYNIEEISARAFYGFPEYSGTRDLDTDDDPPEYDEYND
jgi:hypothetical protein